ncbi:RluA family pseudouridine synthase [Levilactobacillus tujiorum]|uniref:Pseudouridine synthase n=1 Tax=Levilactobacillus tujiorum TaxID=2912243 RepID=A0ABX1L3M7_9LACO|nr:RluA family pseudouridine synthase [Levilactobacillus tujiorum]MCH5463911.1 RluA family pseudouridine synthase [Levilactobacillus tujiorum]NLR11583.1 RluA family pseudouridine synthase [Lactobacillus sp. HBUAS51387]NLR28899.1 RluA family pseudouridine synthase [Levilactobacillus tujiorum]
MTSFAWRVEGSSPMHVRTVLMDHGVTRTFLKQVKFHGGVVTLDGVEVRVIAMAQPGQVVGLQLPPEPANEHVSTSFAPLEILYEDPHFLVVNKPAGMASVPSHLYADDTLANRVKGHLTTIAAPSTVTHIVTRLDRETSGAVLFAKHHFAHSILDKQLKLGQLDKRYVAVAAGRVTPRLQTVEAPIGRAPDSFIKRMVRPDGRQAQTTLRVVTQSKTASLLAVKLHTGRTHQIRVHCEAIGHPLLGDWLYGTQTNPWIHRQALHCARLSFYQPFQQRWVTCYAPLPADMATVIAHEGLSSPGMKQS